MTTKEQYIYSILDHSSCSSPHATTTTTTLAAGTTTTNNNNTTTTRINLWELRECGISKGGFLNDSIRKLVWPKLVGLESSSIQLLLQQQQQQQQVSEDEKSNSRNYNYNNNNMVADDGDHDGDGGRRGGSGISSGEMRRKKKKGPRQTYANHDDNDDDIAPTQQQYPPSPSSPIRLNNTTTNNIDDQQIDLDTSRSTWHILSGNQSSKLFQMKYKQRKRIYGVLKKRQRRLGDFIKLTLGLSGCYFTSSSSSPSSSYCGGSDDDDDGKEEKKEEREEGVYAITRSCGVNNEEKGDRRLRYYQGYHDVGSIILSTLGGEGSNGCGGIGGTTSSWVDNGRVVQNDTDDNANKITPMRFAATQQEQEQQRVSIVESPTSIVSVDLLTSTSHDRHHHGQQQQHHHRDYNTIMNAASSMGLSVACHVLLRLSHSHFRDTMKSDFTHLQAALQLIVLPLIATFDPQLHSHLTSSGVDEPYFCLSWVITWFAHDIHDTDLVKRIFDFFIVSHPLMAVYTSVAMVLHPVNRLEVICAAEESNGDFACVHGALANLPRNSSNVGWEVVPSLGGGGQGGGCDDNNGVINAYNSNSTKPSGSCGHDNVTDAANYDLSLQDMPNITGDWIDNGNDEESVSSSGREERVPFQELIDLSITLMHKIPPRNLINLAQRYHSEITLQPLMAKSSSIALFQPPPAWALVSSADSDRVLVRQKWMREEYGLATTALKLNRHQRKNRRKQLGNSSSSGVGKGSGCGGGLYIPGALPSSSTTTGVLMSRISVGGGLMTYIDRAQIFFLSHMDYGSSYFRAIIASGTGPDGLAKAQKSRKRRRFIVQSTAVFVISMLVMIAKQKWNNSILALGEGRLVDEGGGQKIIDKDWACVRTEFQNRLKLLSSVPDTFSATFDNSNDSVCGAEDNKVVSFEDCGDNDLIQNIEQAKEMAKEVIQIESARAESIYSNKNLVIGSSTTVVVVAPNANEINQEVLLPIVTIALLAKRSAQIFGTIRLNLEKLWRRVINSPHHNTVLQLVQLDFSSWPHNRLFVRHQLWAKQLRIALSAMLSKALLLGLHTTDVHWAMIALKAKDEFALELEGPPVLWADDVTQAWRRREASLRNHARAIIRSVAVVIEDTKMMSFQMQRRK